MRNSGEGEAVLRTFVQLGKQLGLARIWSRTDLKPKLT
jgi:hypothetical protein